MLRYRDTGALHPDFHGTMNATLEYLGSNHGQEALRAVFAATAQNVYRSIYEKLRRGDLSELIEHWRYYLERENADYTLDADDSGVTLTVKACPAVAHVRRLGLTPSRYFCDQTIFLNEAWCEGTPFEASTTIIEEGHCIQRILRRPCADGGEANDPQ